LIKKSLNKVKKGSTPAMPANVAIKNFHRTCKNSELSMFLTVINTR
jgi:hypothetical protein